VPRSAAADGITVQSERIGADGQKFQARYVAIYDGKQRSKSRIGNERTRSRRTAAFTTGKNGNFVSRSLVV
jgi:hypothetical protein